MKPSHKNRIAMMAALFFFASGKISAQTAHLVLHEGAIPGNTRNYDISYSPSDSNIFEAYQSSNIPSGEVTTLTFDLGGLGNLQYPPKPFTSIWFSTTKLGIPLALGSFTDAMHAPYESPGHPGFDIQFGDRGNFLAQGSFTISEISYLPNGKIASFDASFEAHSMPLDDGSIIDRYEGTFSYQAVPEPGTLPLLTLGIFFIFLSKNTRLRHKENCHMRCMGNKPTSVAIICVNMLSVKSSKAIYLLAAIVTASTSLTVGSTRTKMLRIFAG